MMKHDRGEGGVNTVGTKARVGTEASPRVMWAISVSPSPHVVNTAPSGGPFQDSTAASVSCSRSTRVSGRRGGVLAAFQPGSNHLRVTGGFCSCVCLFHADVVTEHQLFIA